jgi:acylphosphatase
MTTGTSVHVVITGRVQGVGFRYATQREAERHGLAGWVRNRPDGSVEAEFHGPADSIESMLSWCRTGPPFARVDAVESTQHEISSETIGFQIR